MQPQEGATIMAQAIHEAAEFRAALGGDGDVALAHRRLDADGLQEAEVALDHRLAGTRGADEVVGSDGGALAGISEGDPLARSRGGRDQGASSEALEVQGDVNTEGSQPLLEAQYRAD